MLFSSVYKHSTNIFIVIPSDSSNVQYMSLLVFGQLDLDLWFIFITCPGPGIVYTTDSVEIYMGRCPTKSPSWGLNFII